MAKVFLIGKSGRVDCIADALLKSSHLVRLFCLSEIKNPGLLKKSEKLFKGSTENVVLIMEKAREIKPDFAIIGPEEPLSVGVVDALQQLGIPSVGPIQSLAHIESSKSFTRKLLSKYNIPGNIAYRVFKNLKGIKEYLLEIDGFVIKPDGLTGGKGVKISGEHLHSIEETLAYCKSIFEAGHNAVLIEEKVEGEEFSLQSFCDGQHVVDSVAVQDHKRAFIGDTGPNTGGMGSYSCENHLLPFLKQEYIEKASEINSAVAKALLKELGKEYKGILYGGFIVTKDGLKLLEYNARFGDPEVMNILPLLKTDFLEVCEAIINGTLDKVPVEFEKKATVCKYIVPKGYPTNPNKDTYIKDDDIPESSENLKVYYGAVDKSMNGLHLTGSRAISIVGIGGDIQEAELIAEKSVCKIVDKYPNFLRHRKDIGTYSLLQKRIDHINTIMAKKEILEMSVAGNM